jgi:hypothetical protein
MLNLFKDLFIRMFAIVSVWDSILYWLSTKGQISVPMMILIFIVEMIVITLSLWYDLKVKKWGKKA